MDYHQDAVLCIGFGALVDEPALISQDDPRTTVHLVPSRNSITQHIL
jgi:hypothetical protein